MGNESSVFEGPPTSPTKEASGKKRIACDEETSVFEIVGTMQSTIVSRSASHSSRNAVNLAWIFTRFMGEHPEIRRQQMTSEDVVERIIKPETKRNKKERYADLLKDSQKNQGGKELVSDGHPFFFVVHVWTQPFADMVDQMLPLAFLANFTDAMTIVQLITYAVRNGLKANEMFVWIDIFAINQWKPSLTGTSDDAIPLVEEVITDSQDTLVVIDRQGRILQRMWCLWEVWSTLRIKVAGKDAIIPLRYGLKMEPLKPRVNALDVTSDSVKTSVQSDKARLMMSIDKSVGGAQSMSLDMRKLFLFLKDTDPVAQEPLVNYSQVKLSELEI